jgi:hypothetical protein
MTDRVLKAFLQRQVEEGLALAQDSDLLELIPFGRPADRFLAIFSCRGLVEDRLGHVVEANRFEVGIGFPADYLRSADTFRVLTWLGPRSIWHPNISNEVPAICVGHLAPGTGLVDLCFQIWEVVTWNKVNFREDDALNPAACQWARNNPNRFPVDRRPLKRRGLDLTITDLGRRPNRHGGV